MLHQKDNSSVLSLDISWLPETMKVDDSLRVEGVLQSLPLNKKNEENAYAVLDPQQKSSAVRDTLEFLKNENENLRQSIRQRTLEHNELLQKYAQLQSFFTVTECHLIESIEEIQALAERQSLNLIAERELLRTQAELEQVKMKNFELTKRCDRVEQESETIKEALANTETRLLEQIQTSEAISKEITEHRDDMVCKTRDENIKLGQLLQEATEKEMEQQRLIDSLKERLHTASMEFESEKSSMAKELEHLKCNLAKALLKDDNLSKKDENGFQQQEAKDNLVELKQNINVDQNEMELKIKVEELLKLNQNLQSECDCLVERIQYVEKLNAKTRTISCDREVQVSENCEYSSRAKDIQILFSNNLKRVQEEFQLKIQQLEQKCAMWESRYKDTIKRMQSTASTDEQLLKRILESEDHMNDVLKKMNAVKEENVGLHAQIEQYEHKLRLLADMDINKSCNDIAPSTTSSWSHSVEMQAGRDFFEEASKHKNFQNSKQFTRSMSVSVGSRFDNKENEETTILRFPNETLELINARIEDLAHASECPAMTKQDSMTFDQALDKINRFIEEAVTPTDQSSLNNLDTILAERIDNFRFQ